MKKNIKNIWKKIKELPLWLKTGLIFSILYSILLLYFYVRCGGSLQPALFVDSCGIEADIILILLLTFGTFFPKFGHLTDKFFSHVHIRVPINYLLNLVFLFIVGSFIGLILNFILRKFKKND